MRKIEDIDADIDAARQKLEALIEEARAVEYGNAFEELALNASELAKLVEMVKKTRPRCTPNRHAEILLLLNKVNECKVLAAQWCGLAEGEER